MPVFQDERSLVNVNFHKLLSVQQQRMMSCEPSYRRGLQEKIFSSNDVLVVVRTSLAELKRAPVLYERIRWLIGITQGIKLACHFTLIYAVTKASAAQKAGVIAVSVVHGSLSTAVDMTNAKGNEALQVGGKRVVDVHAMALDETLKVVLDGKASIRKFRLNKAFGGFSGALDILSVADQAFDLIKTMTEDGGSGIESGIESLENSIRNLEKKVELWEMELAKCG